MKSFLSWTVLTVLFLAGLSATLAPGPVLGDLEGTQKTAATIGAAVLSLVAGVTLFRREPLKSFLGSPPVLWFLFLFNLAVAAIAPFAIGGAKGIGMAIGMGVVSLGAGAGLLQTRGKRRTERA
ncbi:hypothetical protein ACQEWB_20970 [Streptomyces sp. CA-249302]|uniref:hypothetical protein n=1 Tax=Streptomyces sp. CA-249302 TaxID=3240058 RepID=UPI003D8AA943